MFSSFHVLLQNIYPCGSETSAAGVRLGTGDLYPDPGAWPRHQGPGPGHRGTYGCVNICSLTFRRNIVSV